MGKGMKDGWWRPSTGTGVDIRETLIKFSRFHRHCR